MIHSKVWLLTLALAPGAAVAWGAVGHRTIAALAAEQLTPAATAGVVALLAGETNPTLEGVSTWADDVRSPATARLHYVSLPPDCTYIPARDCPGRQCVVAAIEDATTVLRSADSSRADRAIALKELVHFVGDIGQPLHSSGTDKGGNLFQVQAFGHGTNLHALFDSGLIRARGLETREYTAALWPSVATAPAEPFAPFAWAEQSCSITTRAGFFPATHSLTSEYGAAWAPVVDRAIVVSSVRLASLLNSIFTTRSNP